MTGLYPKTTLTLSAAGQVPDVKARMPLILAQGISGGSFTNGALVTNIGNDVNAGNNLCGAGSMGALMINEFKRINTYIQLDAIIVSDNGSGVAATGSIAMTASSPVSGSFTLNIGSKRLNTYTILTTASSTATTIGDSIEAAVNADANSPVSASNSSGTVTFTAKSKGTCGNNMNIHISALPSGVGATITAFSSGATDPSLSGVLDKIDTSRYDIIAPVSFLSTIKTHLEDKFNVDNKLLDGVGFVAKTDTYSNSQTALAPATLASKVIAYFCNKLVNDANHKGGALEELDYVISSHLAALRALRLIPDSLIGSFMTSGTTRGGTYTAGIPYHGMRLLGFSPMDAGKNFTDLEIQGLYDLGGSTFSNDDSGQYVITNPFLLTCYKQANPTSEGFTFRNVNKTDCATFVRDFIFSNLKSKYAQAGLTNGDAPTNSRAVYANENAIKNDIYAWILEMATGEYALVQTSEELNAEVFESIIVEINTATGVVTGSFGFYVMGQLEQFNFNFNIKI
jgi:phage tail sheath gpL-like